MEVYLDQLNILVETKDYADNSKQTTKQTTTTCKNVNNYSDKAGDLICIIEGRSYYKANDEEAAVSGIYTQLSGENLWARVFLVGTTPESVQYYTSYQPEIVHNYMETMEYHGTTYYMAGNMYSYKTTNPITSKYKVLNTSDNPYSSYKDAGKDLLDSFFGS